MKFAIEKGSVHLKMLPGRSKSLLFYLTKNGWIVKLNMFFLKPHKIEEM